MKSRPVKPPRAPARGILIRMAELSIALSPPSLKLRRALFAIHPRPSGRGILAKESKWEERWQARTWTSTPCVDNVFDKSYQITIEKPMKVILGIRTISKVEMGCKPFNERTSVAGHAGQIDLIGGDEEVCLKHFGKRLIFFMNEVIRSRIDFIKEIISISGSIVRSTWLHLRHPVNHG